MITFIEELKSRNEVLYYFSLLLLVSAGFFYAMAKTTSVSVDGVNAWYKPFKFAISIAIYCATMTWYIHYLPSFNKPLFNGINVFLFGFEIIYITLQAARGERSHFNISTPTYHMLYMGMAFAAIGATCYAVYIGWLFFQTSFKDLPLYYVWSIRFGIIVFALFSMQGLMMGSRLTHTVGTEVQTTFLPFLKWNMKEGDLRVAHFIGMHALQVIPLAAFFVIKNTKAVLLFSGLYLLLAAFVLIQALQSKPFISIKQKSHEIIR